MAQPGGGGNIDGRADEHSHTISDGKFGLLPVTMEEFWRGQYDIDQQRGWHEQPRLQFSSTRAPNQGLLKADDPEFPRDEPPMCNIEELTSRTRTDLLVTVLRYYTPTAWPLNRSPSTHTYQVPIPASAWYTLSLRCLTFLDEAGLPSRPERLRSAKAFWEAAVVGEEVD